MLVCGFVSLNQCIIFTLISGVFLKIINGAGRDRYKEDTVWITHRGKADNINMKIRQGYLPCNYPRPNNAFVRTLEHSEPCVWVSIGKPNVLNYFFSGMVQYGFNLASISFKVPRGQIKNPDGILKFVFSGCLLFSSQKVIESDVDIPSDAELS
jgi:hypothetical protein